MKQMVKYAGLIMAVAFLWGACTPDPLDVKNVPVLESKIVISSQVIPGQSIAVLLTKSLGALDAGSGTDAQTLLDSLVINDALVTVTYDDKTDTLQFINTGVYGSINTPLISGVEYNLHVVSPTMGSASSFTMMKPQVRFDSVNAKLTLSGNDTLASVGYRFTDPLGKNWYMICVQRFRATQDLTQNLNPRIFIKLVTDEEFDGQSHQDEFTVPFRRYSEGDTVSVLMANISKEYYTYLKVSQDNRNSISSLVSEPLNLPTNVQNGYGYFNMHIPDVRVFRME
jgi:Domain of unknown function (DUF4249)